MTRSKPISMKKLYKWVRAFLIDRYSYIDNGNKVTSTTAHIAKANKEMSFLNDFLRFVWEHRND